MTEARDDRHLRLRVAAATVFGTLMAMGVGLGIWVIVEAYSPVPFADFWGQFPFLERAVAGDVRIADLWAQANEHRILIPRLEFLMDYRLFEGTNVFLFSMIAASCLLLAAVLAAAVKLETGDRLLVWGTFCTSAIATMSPVGVENFYWAYQVQFVQVFLFAAVGLLGVVAAAHTRGVRRRHWTSVSAVAAVAASYSMANGLVIWPIVLLLAWTMKLGRRATLALGAVGTLTVASYVWHYEFSTHNSLRHPLGMLQYVAVYLGSALRDAGTLTAGLLGAVGVMLFALLCIVGWRERHGSAITTPIGMGLALFVLLTAVQTASGRLDLGIAQALSSRYSTGSFTFWLALMIGFMTPVLDRVLRPAWITGSAYLGVAASVVLAIGWAALPSHGFLHATVAGKQVTVLAFRAGVDDPGGTLTGGPSGSVVSNAFSWMQHRSLGPWAPGGMVSDMRFTPPKPQRPPACRGAVESVESVGGGIRLRGWLAPPEGTRGSQNVAVVDSSGTQRGIGLVGSYRPDVKTANESSSDWTGLVAYTHDRRGRRLEVVQIGRDRRAAVCGLPVPSGG